MATNPLQKYEPQIYTRISDMTTCFKPNCGVGSFNHTREPQCPFFAKINGNYYCSRDHQKKQ